MHVVDIEWPRTNRHTNVGGQGSVSSSMDRVLFAFEAAAR